VTPRYPYTEDEVTEKVKKNSLESCFRMRNNAKMLSSLLLTPHLRS
jgi:hypothetical protein